MYPEQLWRFAWEEYLKNQQITALAIKAQEGRGSSS